MIRSIYRTPTGDLRDNPPLAELPALLAERGGMLWVDFQGNPPEQDEPILRQVFGFHPLAIDDALQESHVPKLDDWHDYLYIVLHALHLDWQADDPIQTLELDIFLGKNYLVTHHDQPIETLDKVWVNVHRADRHIKSGLDYLLYRIIDELVAGYFPIIEQMDDAIDVTEDQVFSQPTSQTLERIFTMKRAVLHMRRIIGPQREVLNRLARDDFAVIDSHERIYYRDVYDHMVRILDFIETLRDLVSGALDTYLSVINNRMNDIMKTLTVITTLFMPISFIASFFGMNYFAPAANLSQWTTLPSFWFTLFLILLLPAMMFLWIRRRGWL
jgi:magnesium transporter